MNKLLENSKINNIKLEIIKLFKKLLFLFEIKYSINFIIIKF